MKRRNEILAAALLILVMFLCTGAAKDVLYGIISYDSATGVATVHKRMNFEEPVSIGTALFNSATELTITADGEITPSKAAHTVDTNADAATDDLDTITAGTDGQILLIRANHTDRTVVVKSGTGNIYTGGSDITLDDTSKWLMFMYDAALSKWVVVGGSGGGGSVTYATAGEINTGTEAAKAISPDALAGSVMGTKQVVLATGPYDAVLATGDAQAAWFVPSECNGMKLVSVQGHVFTVSTSGIPTFQVRKKKLADDTTADMLSTALTIDENERDSSTAATAAAIKSDGAESVATGDEIYLDVDIAGTGTKGAAVILGFRLP